MFCHPEKELLRRLKEMRFLVNAKLRKKTAHLKHSCRAI